MSYLWLYILFVCSLFSSSASFSFSALKSLTNHLSNFHSSIPQINMAEQANTAAQADMAAGKEFKSIAYFVNWFVRHRCCLELGVDHSL